MDEKEVYEKIKTKDPFTVKGISFKIKKSDGTNILINVLNDDVFAKAAEKTIEHFVSKEDYEAFDKGTQPEIKDTGKIIEDLYIPNLYRQEGYISTDERIFTDVTELTKYILFGTTDEQRKYVVKEGDTIDQIAFNNKLGTDEFLVVNPDFSNPNTLLFPGQEVYVGLISPLCDVIVEEHIVEDQPIKYETETTYDDTLAYGTTQIKQKGSDGVQRVVQKRQTTNGIISSVEIDRSATQTIKDPVKEIVVKGRRSSGGGTIVVSPDGNWTWPTNSPYVITSRYGWRWGKLHEGIDISGTGYGSPIRAAADGVVSTAAYHSSLGTYIEVGHSDNYYTQYAHLSKSYVKEGQTVKAGQIIGAMGNSGNVYGTTGTHLHFGAFIGEPYSSGSHSFNPLNLYK
jgi:murein DD-endopeptidase MepM/ murein hydrolase activator NlpD